MSILLHFHETAVSYAGGQVLILDKSVDAAILCINDLSILDSGLPFDSFDLLVWAGNHIKIPDHINNAARQSPQQLVEEFFQSILPACRNKIITVPGLNLKQNQVTQHETISVNNVANVVSEKLLELYEKSQSQYSVLST